MSISKKTIILGTVLFLIYAIPLYGSSIAVSNKYATPGDTAVLIKVSLNNTKPYAGFEFGLNFNSSLPNLHRIEPASRLLGQSGAGYYEFASGKMSLVVFDYNGTSLPADSGIIFNLYFDVGSQITYGYSIISISDVTAVTNDLQYDSVVVKNGVILIGRSYGDANADRKITVADVVYIVSYLFKGGPAPVPLQVADCNCDGQVTIADVIYLINYLFKFGPKPGC